MIIFVRNKPMEDADVIHKYEREDGAIFYFSYFHNNTKVMMRLLEDI